MVQSESSQHACNAEARVRTQCKQSVQAWVNLAYFKDIKKVDLKKCAMSTFMSLAAVVLLSDDDDDEKHVTYSNQQLQRVDV